jgi:precorrin-2/cobalt-factor-2 C20-methyltransferase
MSAVLYGIGCGPGDPELMTLKGLRMLRAADVVFLPATQQGRSYVRTIVEPFLDREDQKIVELVCPAYRDRAAIRKRWRILARELAVHLLPNRTGVFLCEGDPSLYSTFLLLQEGLGDTEADVEIQIIPGVNAVSAAAAAARFPLATWDERLLIAPAAYHDAGVDTLFSAAETIALLKPGSSLPSLLDGIRAIDLPLRAALVRRAGRPEQLVLEDGEQIRQAPRDYFTTLLLRRQRS